MLPSQPENTMHEAAEPIFSEQNASSSESSEKGSSDDAFAASSSKTRAQVAPETKQSRGTWFFRYLTQPILFFLAGALMLGLLGLAQKVGWISSGSTGAVVVSGSTESVDYICPMMCTPPQKEPGRCPVCAMELVPAAAGGSGGDERSIVVDPASRRVANIQTTTAQSVSMSKTIRAVGELQYNESKLKTISAYTNGRFDKLYVDYTGAKVKAGERLASFYSPELYSAQIEFLQAAKTLRNQSAKTLTSVADATRRLGDNSRQRLLELGMTEKQIEGIEQDGTVQSRLDIVAPMSGTVIEKVAVEGEYVKEGQPIFKLADLTSIWLILELFPEDASAVRYGQAVDAQIKSLPGRTFTGRIEFVAPEVDPKSRTVSVRVVFDNESGSLRIGDYAKATITVPMNNLASESLIYDPKLAGKWISPRHPHIICDEPGVCELTGLDLVPTSQYGFVKHPDSTTNAIVIPRNAVLMAAGHSVVYVETEAGRFEMRRIITGATSGNEIAVLKGLNANETIAIKGNFLLDSQMQLAGNPSLIDPLRALSPSHMIPGFSSKMLLAIQSLPQNEQSLAIDQVICPVTDFKLGSMGMPVKVTIEGKSVFLCCEGCRESLLDDAETHLEKLRKYQSGEHELQGDSPGDEHLPPMGEIGAVLDENTPPIGEIQLLPQAADHNSSGPQTTVSEDESGRILK